MRRTGSTRPSGNILGDRLRRVEGRHNALVKELRTAFSLGDLTTRGEFAIEGLRILEEAIRSGVRFRAVFFAESAKPKAERLLPQIGFHVETLMLPERLFAGAVPSESPQGVAALVAGKHHSLEELAGRARHRPLLAIAGLQDPGNLGTVLRSAEAFDAAGVILGEGTVSPFNSKVVRGSAGSIFRIGFVRERLATALPHLRQAGFRLVATSSHKGTALPHAKLSPPLVLVIGGEGAGVPKDVISQMDQLITIPHAAQVESLNAGVAASILLYEFSRQSYFFAE
ncbi:MAG TPA: RNA methyltransferase [Terriglobales bacterium]|nr:RNA methyltransferase [Terriglobales bacterium]